MTWAKELERFDVLPCKRSSGRLELELRCLVRVPRLIRAELKSGPRLPWKQRLRSWKSGFTSNSWVMYNLAENDPDQYVTDLSWVLKMYKINGFYNPIVGNKLIASRLFERHGIPHPNVVSYVFGGRLFDDDRPFLPNTQQTLSDTLERFPRQVFRPTSAAGGEGVFFLVRDGERLKLNGKDVSLDVVCKLLEGLDRYVSTEFVEQAQYARTIYPAATNTIRILSLWDESDDGPFIAGAVHRFGSSRSMGVDNFHGGRGGLCAAVNLETSALSKAATHSADKSLLWASSHPDSGRQIEGVVIPGFDRCIAGVLQAAAHFPFCPCIGWDAVVTENGYCILEANVLPSFTVMQVHVPLLKDPRIRRFFRRWGMASAKRSGE